MSVRLCAWCRQPLGPRRPGSRGPLPTTCSDECRRLAHNRQSLAARVEKFRAAHRPTPCPEIPAMLDVDDPRAFAEGYAETGPLALSGRALTAAVERWEAQQRLERQLWSAERADIEAERQGAVAARTASDPRFYADLSAMWQDMEPDLKAERSRRIRRRLGISLPLTISK